MHLQLTGRLEPGETHATIDFDAGALFSEKRAIVLTLLNITFCSQLDHDHFPSPVTAAYPIDPNRYQETITVLKRSRREIQDDSETDDSPREKRGSEQLLPMQLRYFAGFRKIIFDFEIVDFKTKSPKNVVEQVLNGSHSQAVMDHFQQLLKHSPRYEVTESNEVSKKKIQISLPPLTRLLCNKQSFFGLLGYEAPMLKQVENRDVWYLENVSRTQTAILLAAKAVNSNLNFAFHLGKYAAENKYTINFQRLEPNFSSVLTLDSFCEKNVAASLRLFQLILEGTAEILALPTDSLQATLVTDNVISLDKAENLKSGSDSEDNFGLTIEMGSQMHELVGTNDRNISWSLKKLEIKILPPATEPVAEESTRCEQIVASLKNYFLNQDSSNSIVGEWQSRYQKYLADLQQASVQPAAGDHVPTESSSSETEPGNVAVTSEGDGSAASSSEPTAVDQETSSGQTETRQSEETLTDRATSSNQPPAPPVVEQVEEEEREEVAPEISQPATETVVIKNPARRPPLNYPVANAPKVHICTDPNSFPENCTLVIREGEPFDYLASKGTCSVLGVVRKSRQPNVLSNDCVLKFGPNLSSLSLEIIDNAFNTFQNTGTKSMWIKLDLQYAYLN